MRLRHPDERGQALVEFALILPILVLLLVGLFDFGRAIYAFNTINQAAREAARLAIVDQTVAHVQAEGAKSAVSLAVDEADVVVDFRDRLTPDAPGSCTAAVAGDDNNTDGIVLCIAVVTVPYEYRAATPLIGNLVGTIRMEGESRFKVDFNCEGPECPIGES
jgi:Flp pilus assembly protein TadG